MPLNENEKLVGWLISKRNKEIETGLSPNINLCYFPTRKIKRMSNINMPESVNTLLNYPSLWIEVEGYEYTPDLLVKSFLERKDGEPITSDSFVVFIADCKRAIARDWGIIPRSVWNKQNNQYWNKKFVRAFFTHLALRKSLLTKRKNTFAYKVRDDMTFEEMKSWYLEANYNTARIIVHNKRRGK